MTRVYYYYSSSYFDFQWQLLLLKLLLFVVLAGARSSGSSSSLVPPGEVQDLERGILISTYAATGLGLVVASPPLLVCPIEQLVAEEEHEDEHAEQQPQRRWAQEQEGEGEGEGEGQGDDDRATTSSWPSGETRREKSNGTSPGVRTSPSQQEEEGEGGECHNNNNDDKNNDDKGNEKEEGWIKAGRGMCHETPVVMPVAGGSHHHHHHQQLFCAYARPSFRDGIGIGIITTPETFERILEMDLPVFRARTGDGTRNIGKDDDDEDYLLKDVMRSEEKHSERAHAQQQQQQTPPAYHAVPVAGKGIGMRATRPISANEVYMARTPAVMVDDGAVQALGVARLTALLVAAVEALPGRHRDDFLSLTTHEHVDTLEERVYAIFEKNNFVTNWDGVGAFHSTFTHGQLLHITSPGLRLMGVKYMLTTLGETQTKKKQCRD